MKSWQLFSAIQTAQCPERKPDEHKPCKQVAKRQVLPNVRGRTVHFSIQETKMWLCKSWMFMASLSWFILRKCIIQHSMWKNLLPECTSQEISCIKQCIKQIWQPWLVFARLTTDIRGLPLPVQKSPWDSILLQESNFYCIPDMCHGKQQSCKAKVAVWQRNDRKMLSGISNTL